ncbi:MAG: hypothetical protein LBG82_01655 [Clostridiales Family XIII bacterium]|nr:hypothetical protein [Clostridiales Family XIII bacterium]
MIRQNVLVSKNQIVIRSIPYDLDKETWDEKNIEDGIIWNENYIVLEPLVNDSFGAWFIINKKDTVEVDENSVRSALLPFELENESDFSINTISQTINLFVKNEIDEKEENAKGKYYPLNSIKDIDFTKGKYAILFEICVGLPPVDNPEHEVYYKFTFIKNDNPEFKVLKEDDYGWRFNTHLDKRIGKLIKK